LKAAASADAPPQPVPLGALLDALMETSTGELPRERMTFDWQRDGHEFQIIFTQITLSRKPGEPARLDNCSLLLLEK
jgi:hypothetical protein